MKELLVSFSGLSLRDSNLKIMISEILHFTLELGREMKKKHS